MPAAATGDGWRAGVVAMLPVLLGIVPFGMVAGVAGVENGATVAQSIAFGFLSYSAAAQIAAFDLLGRGAPLLVVIGTATVINLRFAMYSASLARHIAGGRLARRVAGAYLLTDHAYALTMSRSAQPPPTRHLPSYYLGAAFVMWAVQMTSMVAGALLGTGAPEAIPLAFAVPLTFLALLIPALRDRPSVLAAIVAAVVATAGQNAPANAGMLLGALAGVAAGTAAALTGRRRES